MNDISKDPFAPSMDMPLPQSSLDIYRGLPPLEKNQPPISFFEFWPTKIFYIPVVIHWIYLSIRYGGWMLPTIANPNFPFGGLVGESKSQILGCAQGKAKERIAPFITIAKSESGGGVTALEAAENRMADANLQYPVVAKPDLGCRSVGVKVLRSQDDLRDYLRDFPADSKIILQKLVPHEPEAGVLYVREPGTKKGRIFSLTLKYFPYVIGDGISTIEELILKDDRAGRVPHLYFERHKTELNEILPDGQPYRLAFAGSHCRGAIFRNGNDIADGLPGFCFGRFDVRFPHLEELKSGGDFSVIEVNGAGGEATHIWDSRTSLSEAYGTLREQFRLVFQIGAENRRRGHRPNSLWEVYRAYRREGILTANYPSTD
jgi:hypothetical protein